MADYVNILPADENTKGNVWCAACEQSIRAANEERHLISAKHTENAAQSGKTDAKKAPRPKKEAEKPAKPADVIAPEEKKPAKVPKMPKKSEESESSFDVVGEHSKIDEHGASALPLDPKPAPGKEGNRYCGICEQSLGPAKVKSHLMSKKHQANADKVLVNAMQKVAV
jgi:hypothetical protein